MCVSVQYAGHALQWCMSTGMWLSPPCSMSLQKTKQSVCNSDLAYTMQRLQCMHTHGHPAALPQLKASSLCVAHVHVKHMGAASKRSREQSQSHLKTAALLPNTKSSRSSTNGRGNVGALSHFSMPSLAACNQAGLRPSRNHTNFHEPLVRPLMTFGETFGETREKGGKVDETREPVMTGFLVFSTR